MTDRREQLRLARVRHGIADHDDRDFELDIAGRLFVVDGGLIVPVPEPVAPEPVPHQGPFWHWLGGDDVAPWHAYRTEGPAPWRTLCGQHDVRSMETKTPGGRSCLTCCDLAELPADHWRRRGGL